MPEEKEYISKNKLILERGWHQKKIRELLDPPDKIENHDNSIMKLYNLERVEEIEQENQLIPHARKKKKKKKQDYDYYDQYYKSNAQIKAEIKNQKLIEDLRDIRTNAAGIGTRNISMDGVHAIRKLFSDTFRTRSL